MKRAADAWRQRSARERALLTALGVVLILAALWQGVWLPLQGAIDAQQQRRHLLAQQLRRLPPQQAAGDLSALLRQRAAAAAIPLAGIQPEQGGRVRLTIAATEADALLAWLAQLETQDALRVAGLDIRASAPPDGRVSVESLLLERR